MKIASWNVNSLRARRDLVVDWLRRVEPEILCLQETKCTDADFPADDLERLGYAVAMAGEPSYNGVAILTREKLSDVAVGFTRPRPNDSKRLIRATIGNLRVYSCYIPNGRGPLEPEFADKLDWLARLRETLDDERATYPHICLGGDFNIARDDRDVFDPEAMRGQLHFHPREHEALNHLLAFGLEDAFRIHEQRGKFFSWWDYRAGALRRNDGLRIDYVFLTPELAQACVQVTHDVAERKKLKPSDHCPVVAELRWDLATRA